ncbi:Plasmodium exported protein (PHISTa), unknown, putative [Plasmodium sp.]|nr:Plasmodium exported protein (PHISTa), unknown, putative [Plasmodium sp.]
MKNKKNLFFSLYHDNENKKGKLHYISFKFLCLSLYIIGFYYIFLNISLENKSLEIVKISNLYERNLVENKSNSPVCNINYNDMSRKLTEKELHDVLNSLETCPPKEDLKNIWNHTIGVAKEGLDDIQKLLYTKDFFSLINGKHTIDDILKFIYSFLEHFETLKKELYKKYQKELLADVEQEWFLWEHRNEYY